MVVSIGMRLQNGPWGGGNQFGTSLATFLRAHGIFDGPDLPRALHDLALSYHVWADRVQSYPYSAEAMCRQYLAPFEELVRTRERAPNDYLRRVL